MAPRMYCQVTKLGKAMHGFTLPSTENSFGDITYVLVYMQCATRRLLSYCVHHLCNQQYVASVAGHARRLSPQYSCPEVHVVSDR